MEWKGVDEEREKEWWRKRRVEEIKTDAVFIFTKIIFGKRGERGHSSRDIDCLFGTDRHLGTSFTRQPISRISSILLFNGVFHSFKWGKHLDCSDLLLRSTKHPQV